MLPILCSSFGNIIFIFQQKSRFSVECTSSDDGHFLSPCISVTTRQNSSGSFWGLCIGGKLQTLNWIPVVPTVFMQEITLIWALRQGINLQFLESCMLKLKLQTGGDNSHTLTLQMALWSTVSPVPSGCFHSSARTGTMVLLLVS